MSSNFGIGGGGESLMGGGALGGGRAGDELDPGTFTTQQGRQIAETQRAVAAAAIAVNSLNEALRKFDDMKVRRALERMRPLFTEMKESADAFSGALGAGSSGSVSQMAANARGSHDETTKRATSGRRARGGGGDDGGGGGRRTPNGGERDDKDKREGPGIPGAVGLAAVGYAVTGTVAGATRLHDSMMQAAYAHERLRFGDLSINPYGTGRGPGTYRALGGYAQSAADLQQASVTAATTMGSRVGSMAAISNLNPTLSASEAASTAGGLTSPQVMNQLMAFGVLPRGRTLQDIQRSPALTREVLLGAARRAMGGQELTRSGLNDLSTTGTTANRNLQMLLGGDTALMESAVQAGQRSLGMNLSGGITERANKVTSAAERDAAIANEMKHISATTDGILAGINDIVKSLGSSPVGSGVAGGIGAAGGVLGVSALTGIGHGVAARAFLGRGARDGIGTLARMRGWFGLGGGGAAGAGSTVAAHIGSEVAAGTTTAGTTGAAAAGTTATAVAAAVAAAAAIGKLAAQAERRNEARGGAEFGSGSGMLDLIGSLTNTKILSQLIWPEPGESRTDAFNWDNSMLSVPGRIRDQISGSWRRATAGDGIGDVGTIRTHKPDIHVTGMQPAFRSRVERMFRDNPNLRLNSGYRSIAEQERLWKEALVKYGDPEIADNHVARPGRSNHNRGLAADIGPESQYGWIRQNAAKYGLELPMAHEPWHVEPMGLRSGAEMVELNTSTASATFGGEPSTDFGRGRTSGSAGGGAGGGAQYSGGRNEIDLYGQTGGGGGATGAPGGAGAPRGGGGLGAYGPDAADGSAVEQYLRGLRQVESGNQNINHHLYDPRNPGKLTASGYYQYINSTWNNYGGFARAIDAPFEVQHERARADALAAFSQFGNWGAVAALHMSGDPAIAGDPSRWNQTLGHSSNSELATYVNNVLTAAGMAGGSSGSTSMSSEAGLGKGVGDPTSRGAPSMPSAPRAVSVGGGSRIVNIYPTFHNADAASARTLVAMVKRELEADSNRAMIGAT